MCVCMQDCCLVASVFVFNSDGSKTFFMIFTFRVHLLQDFFRFFSRFCNMEMLVVVVVMVEELDYFREGRR